MALKKSTPTQGERVKILKGFCCWNVLFVELSERVALLSLSTLHLLVRYGYGMGSYTEVAYLVF